MNETIVYVDGVFDLFHVGHISFLKKARQLGTKLIIGVVTDEDAISYKRRPIIPFQFRKELIEELNIAIKVIPAMLHINKDFIKTNNINIVVHADDDEQADFFKVPREMGIMQYVPYTTGICTTDIIKWFNERTT